MRGRPPAEPRRARPAFWSSRSGMVTLMPRSVRNRRLAAAVYALSASTLVGSGAWASGSTVVDADAAHNGGEQRRVGRVTGGEHQTQWPALAVAGEVDLAGHSASGPTDRVVRRLRLAELPVVPSGPLCRA